MINVEAIEEFSLHFDKGLLESSLLELEGALSRNSDEKVEVVQALFREIHSLKGSSGMLKLDPITKFLHAYEDALGVLSRGIHQISAVKKNEVFDFFLQGLDLTERLLDEFTADPECELKDQKQLFSFYVRMLVEARSIMEQGEEYFEFEALNEELF